MVLLAIVLAMLVGGLIGFGNVMFAAPVVALVGIVALMRIPMRWQVWALCASCFLISGPIVYFAKIDAARWMPVALALGLFVPLTLRAASVRKGASGDKWPGFVGIMLLFIVSSIFGAFLHDPRLNEVATAARSYFVFWAVALVIGMGFLSERQIENIWRFLLAAAFIQVPVTMFQYFYVVKKLSKGAAWDAVVGTFPGNPEGGGASAGMGVFVLVMIVWALAMWRRKQLKGFWLVLIIVAALITVSLAEIKAVVLLIPVTIAMVYYQEVIKRPLQSMLAVAIGAALVAGILAGYQAMYYDKGFTLAKNSAESPMQSIQNQLNPTHVLENSAGLIQMSRAALMLDWWDRNVGQGDFEHALLGYGMGATSISRLGSGELVGRFPYAIDMTSTTMLLWETGILGHLLFGLSLLFAAQSAAQSSKDPRVPLVHQALLQATAIALLLMFATLAYKNFVLRTAPSQFLLAFLMGQALYWSRKLSSRDLEKNSNNMGSVRYGSRPKSELHGPRPR
jgi:hypothetical protein